MSGYEPIPDIEEGRIVAEQAPAAPQISPQEKYPQASEKEAELLCMLDDVISNAIPKFDPPLLPVDPVSEGAAKDLPGLIAAIQIPAMVFVAAVLGTYAYFVLVIYILLCFSTKHQLCPAAVVTVTSLTTMLLMLGYTMIHACIFCLE